MIDIEQFKSELALATDKRERLGCPKGVCCNNHLFIDSDYVRAVEDELRVYEEHVPGLLKKLLMTSGETRAIDRTYAGILSQKAKGRSKR